MRSLVPLLRRGLCVPSSPAAAALAPLEVLVQAFSTLAAGIDPHEHAAAAQQVAQQPGVTATAVAHNAAPLAGHGGSLSSSHSIAAAFGSLQQRMAAALAAGQCQEVLRLLPSDRHPVSTASSPLQRAQLFDLALQAAADACDADAARRLVGRMLRQGIPLGTVAHTATLRALCSAGRHADALRHLRSVPAKRQRTGLYTVLLRACNDAGAVSVAQQCYEHFLRRRHEPDAAFSAEVVRMLGSSGDTAAAQAAWEAAMAAATTDGERAGLLAARAGALARAGQLDAAVTALEDMLDRFSDLLPVDVSSALSSSRSSSSSSGSSSSGEERQQMAGLPPPPAPVAHMQRARNEVLAAAQAVGDAAAARRVTSLAMARGLPPDLGTYHCLLRAAIANGDGLAAVQDGVAELRRLGMRPTRETFSLLLRACAVEANPAAAQAALDSMPAEGVVPTRLHHVALLRAYSRAGDLEGVHAAYRRMREAGFAPDAATFQVLLATIRNWATLETAQRAEVEGSEIFEARNERYHARQVASAALSTWVADLDAARPCLLDSSLFTSLIHAYSQCGEIGQVLLLMRRAYGCQLSPATQAWLDGELVGSGHGGSRDGGSVGGIGIGATAGTLSGASSSSSTQISSTASGGGTQQSDAPAALPQSPLSASTLARAQLAPTLAVFNAAIGACARVGHRHMADAVALLHALLACGLSPDLHTYTSLISGCAYVRQAGLARELWRQMGERHIAPSVVAHNAMLKVEVFTHGVDAGVAYIAGMVQRGVSPDRATWSTLLAAARHAKRGDVAATAQRQLAALQPRGQQAAEAVAEEDEGGGPPSDEHRWHGYYEQQEDEDEW